MKKLLKILVLSVVTVFSGNCPAYSLADQVVEFKLDNGMRWLFVRRTQAPVFSGIVILRVGGADETPGKTGLAHMFEHMAFKGSKDIGTRDWEREKPVLDEIEKAGAELTEEQQKKRADGSKIAELKEKLGALQKEADKYQSRNEIWEVMSRNGAADLNAYTSKDITAYHSSMPINRLKLWARVTADMIFNPVYREFYIERNVVAEERRSTTENDPDGVMEERIISAAYGDGPYSWPVIGYDKDIHGLTLEDARRFHDSHYVPENMVGALVGDFTIAEAKKIIKENFGKYPAGGAPPPGPSASGTPKGGVKEKFSFRAEPAVAIAYHKPTLPDPSEYPFDVITSLLCEGMSSRLQKSLVYEKRMAESVYCTDSYPGSRFSNLLLLWVQPQKPYSPSSLLKEVSSEISRIKKEPATDEELQRVRKRVTSSFIFSLEKNMGLAESLATFESVFGDWRFLDDYPNKIAAVTSQDVMETARKYLSDDNLVVVTRTKSK